MNKANARLNMKSVNLYLARIRGMVSFELGKEREKDVFFCLDMSMGQT